MDGVTSKGCAARLRKQPLHRLRCEVVAQRHPADSLDSRLQISAVALVSIRDAVDRCDGVGVDGLLAPFLTQAVPGILVV